MKLKRFLALAVSLAMVLTIVPAFSVSAAGTTGVIDALGGEVLWACPDGSFNDTAIGTAFSGWSSSITSGYVNVKTYSGVGNVIQYYVNGTENKTTITSPGYGGNGEDAIVIEWVMKRQNPSDLYFDFSFFDKNGTEIAFLKLDRNFTAANTTNNADYYAMGYPAEGTDCAIVAQNNGDGTHKVEYYVGGSVVATQASLAGEIEGFGGIASSNGRWSTTWNHIGFGNLTIGAVSFSETKVDVTATYTVNGEAVKTASGNYDPAEGETGAEFAEVYYSADGSNALYYAAATELAEDGEIAMTAVANGGPYAVGDIFAKDGVQYEVKSANLIPNGDFAYGLAGWLIGDGTQATSASFTVNGDGTVTSVQNAGNGGAGCLYRSWAIEADKTYAFIYDEAATAGDGNWRIFSLDNAVGSTETNILNKATAAGNKQAYVFTNTDGYAYAKLRYRWNGTDSFGNFGLYEIAEAETVVAETIASVADITSVKVVGDTAVVLPTTVEVTGSLGSTVAGVIEWNAPESYEVGTTTVEGTVSVKFADDAETLTQAVSTTVTVLEETFTLSDIASGATSDVTYFPVELSGEFTLQFDMTASNYDNLWIYIGANGALWGAGQIGLGWDSNETGYFRAQPAAQTNVQFATGNNYRFFVTGSAATDTYDLMVVDLATNAVIATADDYGFRSGSDVVNAIVFTPNGENGVGTMSNIKVNAPGVSKTEYTFNITIDGETSTTTASYWSETEAVNSVADITGYQKAVAVDGTTINVVYSATQTLKATFIDANENVIKTVEEVVALGETVTVNAEEIFFLDADYNGYFYQIPEIVLSADNNNLVVTVTETANKYAVKEDALITGGTEIWGVKAENNNSVFVASAGSASAPTQDANGENNFGGGNTPSTLGTSRLGFFLFPVVDVEEGQKVTANFYVREWHGNGFSNGNTMLRLTAHAVTDNSWATLPDGDKSYSAPDATLLESWNTPVFSNACYNNLGYITFDVTEIMVAAKAAGLTEITIRLNAPYGAAYIAEREKATVGKAYEGKAAYLAVSDAGLVKVTAEGDATLTKNGSAMNGFAYVAASDDVRSTTGQEKTHIKRFFLEIPIFPMRTS